MKIWTCGSSPRRGSRSAWTRIENVNGVSRLSSFWNFFDTIHIISCRTRLVTMDETWLYQCDPETKQQSMEWRHNDTLHPKKYPSAKIRWKISRLDFFGIKTASFSLIIFQRAKLSTQSITHLRWCNWRTFWRKILAGRSSSVSCRTTMPRLTGRRNWPT